MVDDIDLLGRAAWAAVASPGVPAAVFERNPVPMGVVDEAGVLVAANTALARYLGHDLAALIGTPMRRHAAPAHASWVQLGSGERRLRHARGHELWAAVSAVPLPEVGTGAALVCLHDTTSRRNTERMMLHAAMHDSLTNLPNRRLLRDRLDTALSRAVRTSARVAVLFVDLDNFKGVNDTWGHDAGDEVLVSVAGGILGALRSCDTVARLGGDEFVVVCEDLDGDEDLDRLVARLRSGISHPVELHGARVEVSASVGVALAKPGGGQADELLRLADLAMLAAKRDPEAPYVVADPDSSAYGGTVIDLERRTVLLPRQERRTAAGARRILMAELAQAIAADLLELHYQPVVRVDGRVMGLEALLRWPHPRLGLLLPGDFLPEVDAPAAASAPGGTAAASASTTEAQVADALSDWVLRTAVRDAAGWDDPGLRVSINVWAAQVARPGFVGVLSGLLTAAGLAPRGLYLELHEQDLRDAGPAVTAALRALRRLGVGVAIDDLGADANPGSASTGTLGARRLPVDTVKVSRDVVARAVADREDGIAAAAVVIAARAAGRHPLAMGVETVEQLRLVRELGYASLQGLLTGPPAALFDLRELIALRRVELPTTSGGRHTRGAPR